MKKSIKDMIAFYIELNTRCYPNKLIINNVKLIEDCQNYMWYHHYRKHSQETIGRKFREIREYIKLGYNPYNLDIKVVNTNKSSKSITFEIKIKG